MSRSLYRTSIKIYGAILAIFVLLHSAVVCGEPQNLGLLKKDIQNYYSSGKYTQELHTVTEKAKHYIIARAKANAHHTPKKKLALVLDIDETCLSNYTNIHNRDFSNDPKQIHRDLLAANSPSIPAMLSLYQEAIKLGIHVFFVTGRPLADLKITRKNLLRAGFHDWSGLYLKPDYYRQQSVIPFKTEARRSIEADGYTIIASIGDQYSDLKGGHTQATFKLPNPFYYLP